MFFSYINDQDIHSPSNLLIFHVVTERLVTEKKSDLELGIDF